MGMASDDVRCGTCGGVLSVTRDAGVLVRVTVRCPTCDLAYAGTFALREYANSNRWVRMKFNQAFAARRIIPA